MSTSGPWRVARSHAVSGIHGHRCGRRCLCYLEIATHDGERLLYLMSLEPGTTLGPYTVTAKIGEGGMGEAYRARDTKLDRDVALKVLPQAFTP